MDNFKEALIQFAHSNPTLFPNNDANSCSTLIKQCFSQFFSDAQTPNHPTYSVMIYTAIWELNKKRGCSEKSISKYIKRKYTDLPWAHRTLLKHHLQKLCDCNEICMTPKQCYLLTGTESEPAKEISGPNRPHKKYKKKEKSVTDVQETGDTEKIGIRKRKKKLKKKTKSSKCVKKHEITETNLLLLNEGNLNENNNESHEQNQIVKYIQIEEQNEVNQEIQESHNDNSDYINIEQVQTKNDPELLQLEESPNTDPVSNVNGERVCTRSQLKKVSKKDEEQQISSSSSEKPLIEILNSISSKLKTGIDNDEPTTGQRSTEVQDSVSSHQDQQPESSTVEAGPKYKRRGRPSKPMEPKKGEVLRNIKPVHVPMKRRKSAKGKVGKKKVQPEYTMIRRSSRIPSY